MGKKKIIKTENDFEGVLFGIISQLRDYQLCWHLNKHLSFEMEMMDDLEITHKKKNKTATYSWFRYEDELDKLFVYLLSNKYSGEYLIPEIKQADFLFMVQGELSEKAKNELFSALKEIQAVQMVFEINYSQLKSKENLVLE